MVVLYCQVVKMELCFPEFLSPHSSGLRVTTRETTQNLEGRSEATAVMPWRSIPRSRQQQSLPSCADVLGYFVGVDRHRGLIFFILCESLAKWGSSTVIKAPDSSTYYSDLKTWRLGNTGVIPVCPSELQFFLKVPDFVVSPGSSKLYFLSPGFSSP